MIEVLLVGEITSDSELERLRAFELVEIETEVEDDEDEFEFDPGIDIVKP